MPPTDLTETNKPKKGIKGVKNPTISTPIVEDVDYKVNSTFDTSDDIPQIVRPRRPFQPASVLVGGKIKVEKVKPASTTTGTNTKVIPHQQPMSQPPPAHSISEVNILNPAKNEGNENTNQNATDDRGESDHPIDLSVSRDNNTSNKGILNTFIGYIKNI